MIKVKIWTLIRSIEFHHGKTPTTKMLQKKTWYFLKWNFHFIFKVYQKQKVHIFVNSVNRNWIYVCSAYLKSKEMAFKLNLTRPVGWTLVNVLLEMHKSYKHCSINSSQSQPNTLRIWDSQCSYIHRDIECNNLNDKNYLFAWHFSWMKTNQDHKQ